MKTNWVLTTAVVAMSVTAALDARSANDMGKASKPDTMSMTYTGCVESVNHGAAFLLTRVDSGGAESKHGDMAMKHHDDVAMKHDDVAMKHDDAAMKHDDAAMKHDDVAMKHDDVAMKSDAAKTMQHEPTPMPDEKMDAMASKSFVLAGSTDLSKHVGQKVTATGSLSDGSMGTMRQDLSTFTIKSLKVIAKSCS